MIIQNTPFSVINWDTIEKVAHPGGPRYRFMENYNCLRHDPSKDSRIFRRLHSRSLVFKRPYNTGFRR